MFPIVEIFVQKRELYILFSDIVLLVFPQIPPYSSIPESFPAATTSTPLYFVSKLKGGYHFLPAEKTNIPTIDVHLDGGKSVTGSQNIKYIYYCPKGPILTFLLLCDPLLSVHIE